MTIPLGAEYYVLANDMSVAERWYLGAPKRAGVNLDPRDFIQGSPLHDTDELTINQRQVGAPLAFTLADFDLPVFSRQLAEVLATLAPREIQRIPVRVLGVDGDYEILNATKRVDALDVRRSTVVWWESGGIRPDLVGKPKLVLNLHVDPARAAGHKFFRLDNWNVPLIVSREVAHALVGYSGVQLQPA